MSTQVLDGWEWAYAMAGATLGLAAAPAWAVIPGAFIWEALENEIKKSIGQENLPAGWTVDRPANSLVDAGFVIGAWYFTRVAIRARIRRWNSLQKSADRSLSPPLFEPIFGRQT